MIRKILLQELQKYEAIKKVILSQRKNTKGETMTCRKIHGHFQYCIDRKYVSKKKEIHRIRDIARGEYQNKILPLIDGYLLQLEDILKTEKKLYAVYEQMHEGKQVLFEPDVVSVAKKLQDFSNATGETLPFSENDRTEYVTRRGERVRSKSEKIIADELDRNGIPYKYEKPLLLQVDNQLKEFHPDFTAMNITTGEIKYIEHLGMMDNPNYYNNVLSKLDVYERNGLMIGRDIMLLHESAYRPLNMRVLQDYIQEFLM